jgi:hypothetical protein
VNARQHSGHVVLPFRRASRKQNAAFFHLLAPNVPNG